MNFTTFCPKTRAPCSNLECESNLNRAQLGIGNLTITWCAKLLEEFRSPLELPKVEVVLMPTPHEDEILTILIEECSEVIQRATKLQRFGATEVQPGQPYDNAYRLGAEVGDLLHMIDLCVKEDLIDPEGVKFGRQNKPEQLKKYLRHKKQA